MQGQYRGTEISLERPSPPEHSVDAIVQPISLLAKGIWHGGSKRDCQLIRSYPHMVHRSLCTHGKA